MDVSVVVNGERQVSAAYAELSDRFQPTLNVPVDTGSGSSGRNLFRQFRGGSPELIASIDKTATTYIDRNAW